MVLEHTTNTTFSQCQHICEVHQQLIGKILPQTDKKKALIRTITCALCKAKIDMLYTYVQSVWGPVCTLHYQLQTASGQF